MKVFLTLIISLVALTLNVSAAEVSGRAYLTVMPQTSAPLVTDIRQEGDKVLGMTDFGSVGLVNLLISSKTYRGVAGGNSLTSLACVDGKCQGVIGGRSANFTSKLVETSSGDEVQVEGSLNFNQVHAKRSATSIEITSPLSTLYLKKGSDGVWSGYGTYGYGLNSYFTATLVTSGTLDDFKDAALFTIFLVSPFQG